MHAHAADPLQAYGELFKSAPLPPLMRQGIMEPHILKHYLLLHDDAAAPGGLARSACSNRKTSAVHALQLSCAFEHSRMHRGIYTSAPPLTKLLETHYFGGVVECFGLLNAAA